MARQYGHALRDGTHEIFSLAHEMNVPVLVFSAGLGDSIQAVLRHEQIMLPNVKLVSNFLKYDSGLVDGFSDEYPLIHTFNKNETVLEGTEYYDMVHNRTNVILMGFVFILIHLQVNFFLNNFPYPIFLYYSDSLADAGMAEGVPKTSSILKIGFLFDHVSCKLNIKDSGNFSMITFHDQGICIIAT